jgi:hypothetical protein
MSNEPLSSSGYIKHHLTNLAYGQKEDGTWGIATSTSEATDMGFWVFHLDTLGFSVGLGVLFSFLFYFAAKKAHSRVPVGWLNFVEWIIEFINETVKESFKSKNNLIAPLSLTIITTTNLAKGTIETVDTPTNTYPNDHIYDTEAAHFYSGIKHKQNKKITILKIISDNKQNPISKLKKDMVQKLILQNINKLKSCIMKNNTSKYNKQNIGA